MLKESESALSPPRELEEALEGITSEIATLSVPLSQFDAQLQAKLREISEAFEQTRIQLAEASRFAYAASTTSDAVRTAEQFTFPKFVFPEFPKLAFPELPRIDSGRTISMLRKGAVRLGERGWAIPAWTTPREVQVLGKRDDSEIGDFFVDSYLESESRQGQLEGTSRNLLASAEMERWRSLLEEIFYCVQNGKYRVCVPALLTILEGFTAHSLYKRSNTSRRQTNVSVSINRAGFHSDSTVDGVIWNSLVVFLDRLFASFDFEASSPIFINRHWILHGRSDTEWTVADALKLVNALATLHWLFS